MNTTTKPGVLAVMDAAHAYLLDMRSPAHSRDMAEARATVERLAEALQRVQYVRGLTGAAKAAAWDKLDGEIDAALAAFLRGEA